MVFRTRYGYFKYTVIPFGFINALIIFQAYIYKAFAGLLNISYIVFFKRYTYFLPNRKGVLKILIFGFKKPPEYRIIRQVFERLFFCFNVGFLGSIVRAYEI